MNKKVFTTILVFLIAMTCAFAYKGEIKVGLDLGVGSDNVAYDDGTNKATGIVLGGNLTGSVQYGLSDSLAFKAELGFNTYSDGAIFVNDEQKYNYEIADRNPNCVFYFGAVYNLSIGRSGLFEWEFGAGLQGTAGSCFKTNAFNLSLGLGFEETFIFNVTDNIAVTATTRAGVQVVNTNSEFANWIKECDSMSIPVYMTAGVTYSL
jgi:hypothetical protein